MDVVVLSRARKRLSRSVFGSRLAGDGLLVRLRSTSIGILGIVTAVGLGLVAFISQLGWPGVLTSPIPGSHSEAGTVHDAIALTRPAAGPASATIGGHRGARRVSGRSASSGGQGDGRRAGSSVGSSRQLEAGGGAAPTPTTEAQPEPPAEPAPAAPQSPAAPTSSPEGQPAESPPTTASPGPTTSSTSPKDGSNQEGGSKGHTAEGKPKSHPKSHDGGSTKTTSVASGKGKTKAPPAPTPPPPPKPAPPPAAAPPSSDKSGAVEPGWGKDGGGPGKSDWHRH